MSDVVALLEALNYEENQPELEVPSDFPSTVEDRLGITLPSDYREFLEAYPRSGGPAEAVLISPLDDEDEEPMSWMQLHGYEGSGDGGLIGRNEDYPDTDIPGAIVIGDDIMGNFLYMAIAGDAPGSVYFYDRVEPFEGTLESLTRLSASFSDFLMRTTVDPDD